MTYVVHIKGPVPFLERASQRRGQTKIITSKQYGIYVKAPTQESKNLFRNAMVAS